MITINRKAIAATGTTVENEPIVKSDGASSDVMQWLSNNEGSNITISEDDSNNLDLGINGGDVKIQNAGTSNLIIDNTYSGGGESGQEWLLMNANSGADSTLQIKAGISDGAASSGRLVMLMSATGNVGVGVVPNSKLDVFTTSYNNIRIGEDKDNQSTQRGGIIAQPYLTAEQATAGMLMYVDGTGATQDTANLQLGGGHGSYNAVKQISFYTAANATTTTGTERLTIDSAGLVTASNGIVETNGVLKENLLSNSGFDVWSNSTLEDVGSELVTNGGFDSAATGWTGDNATLASVSGGQSGNCLEVTRTGNDNQKATQAVTVVAGKLYKVTAYVKSGGSGNEAFKLQLLDGSTVTGTTSGTSSGSWVQYSVVGEALTTSMTVQLIKNTATADTMLFDTVTYFEVTPGCIDNGNSLAADTHAKDSTLDCFREHDGSNTKEGSFYALRTLNGAANRSYYITSAVEQDPNWLKRIAGRTLTFGVWVKTSTASHARLGNYDGSSYEYSAAYVSNDGNWHWMEITRTFPAAPTYGRFFFHINVNGATAYFSQPMLVFGNAIGAGNYSRPSGEVIWFENEVASNLLNNTTGHSDVSWTALNVEADSNGKIPKGAKAVAMQIRLNDSASSSGSEANVQLGAYTDGNNRQWSADILGIADDKAQRKNGWIPCNSTGDPDYNISASGSGTLDIPLAHYYGVELR